MYNQGKQLAIDAIYRVIYSTPKPYNQYLSYNMQYNDITYEQFENWKNYIFQVLDISYSNLGLYDFMNTKNNISYLIQQFYQYNQTTVNKAPYMQLVNQINNELIHLIQRIQY